MKNNRFRFVFLLWAASIGSLAQAATLNIARLSPQGEVAQVRQVVAGFATAAVPLGDLRAPAPLEVACSQPDAAKGSGRWTSEREWVYEFAQNVPPGVHCTISPVATFTAPSGATLDSRQRWNFHTGGPFVQRIWPYEGDAKIDEEQYFVLTLNGSATSASVLEHVWCVADGVGERIPVRLIEGQERTALLKARDLLEREKVDPQRYITLTCNRRLTEGAKVQLVYGAGVTGDAGIANKVEQRFHFTVRQPFRAQFQCERENAHTGCLPMKTMQLAFNAPVLWELAKQIRLEGTGLSLEPDIGGSLVDAVYFSAPGEHKLFPLQTALTLTLPHGFQDASGRKLINHGNFPLEVRTGDMPPLAKFAAAPFGILERYAEGKDAPALLPVTLRRVESQLAVQGLQPAAGQTRMPQQVHTLQPDSDEEIIRWLRRVKKYNKFWVARSTAQRDAQNALPPPLENDDGQVQTRMLSLLHGRSNVQTLNVPPSGEPRPFEVVGIPLSAGFHVVEIASPLLGQSLLDERYGEQRTMYVRTAALVTNLGVHFKLGRENAVAWVTTLDNARPVANARVQVSDCNGNALATAVTNAQGVAVVTGLSPRPPSCDANGADDDKGDHYWESDAYFVSARTVDDMAFVWSDWNRGIEAWRFGFETDHDPQLDKVAHTIFDRTLVRAGEAVSMKHLLRDQTQAGFAATQPEQRPNEMLITHSGSGQTFKQPLHWRVTTTGGLSAENQFTMPKAAKLGTYQVALHHTRSGQQRQSGSFRVEEFRLPILEGRIDPPTEMQPLVRPGTLPANVQVNYIAGGGAAGLPVKVSAMLRGKRPHWANFGAFHFTAPDAEEQTVNPRVIADKLPVTLDSNGAGHVTIKDIPHAEYARELLLEASYADPSGELQTLRSTHTLWPAAVAVGIKVEDSWVSASKNVRFQALALGLDGAVQANVPLQVRGITHITTTTRKRLVGGFYSYDSHTTKKDLGVLCSGHSDSRGLLHCSAALNAEGEVELIATASDAKGRKVQAVASVWVTNRDELWFGGEDHDRIDVLPEKNHYQPGEVARLQLRMPFRTATALVSIEREGIIDTRVMTIKGQDPSIAIKIEPDWSPNVYISVLAVRGRLREVPWYSFFTWGFKEPAQWWNAWRNPACKEEGGSGDCVAPPTAMVDLSKPAYRLGATQIFVGHAGHRMDVKVMADQTSYPVRGKAQVTIQARLPDGSPAAGAELALAVVDQALLELMPNRSWKLLEAMLQHRAWGVETATAQMEIIGRRHYGKKAVPAGGGGGIAQTRELFDTLLLWQPDITLDAQGQAQVTVPLNDALTTFKVVAIADMGVGFFGTGETSIRATQDLQIISGLPPLVREGDSFRAQFTLRNNTQKDMQVEVKPLASLSDTALKLEAQSVTLPAGGAREVAWDITTPAAPDSSRTEELRWDVEATDQTSGARDAIRISQRVTTPVPLTVLQATLEQLDGSLEKEAVLPKDALPMRSGLKVTLQSSLTEGLPAVRDWWANYPFVCLEQQASKAIGLRDAALWQTLMTELPTYLDSNGLAHYFPPSEADDNSGSDTLTAYLLAASHEAAGLYREFTLPAAQRDAMLQGLAQFVEGKIQRNFWSPRKDLDLRKLAAIEALSRYNRAHPRMLDSITIAPNQWPTHTVIDWVNIVQRMHELPKRQQYMVEALQILNARLSFQGSKLVFGNEQNDYYWWLMQNEDVNSARLILTMLTMLTMLADADADAAWQGDMGRLVNGFIARQKSGVWHTTTANMWGGLTLEKFAAKWEAEPVAGMTRVTMHGKAGEIDWAHVARSKTENENATVPSGFDAAVPANQDASNTIFLPWEDHVQAGKLHVTHQGTGKPWIAIQSVAALRPDEAIAAGYTVKRSVIPIEQANPNLPPGMYTRGDIVRIKLAITAATDMTWVVVTDPIPAGATILGSGLGRDSAIATQGEKRSDGRAVFQERAFEAFRSYYDYVPKGSFSMEYTVRLNNAGDFSLPPSRVEALYAPEIFGILPNDGLRVVMPE